MRPKSGLKFPRSLKLPVVNVKKTNFAAIHGEISLRKSDFRGEKINRLNV